MYTIAQHDATHLLYIRNNLVRCAPLFQKQNSFCAAKNIFFLNMVRQSLSLCLVLHVHLTPLCQRQKRIVFLSLHFFALFVVFILNQFHGMVLHLEPQGILFAEIKFVNPTIQPRKPKLKRQKVFARQRGKFFLFRQ